MKNLMHLGKWVGVLVLGAMLVTAIGCSSPAATSSTTSATTAAPSSSIPTMSMPPVTGGTPATTTIAPASSTAAPTTSGQTVTVALTAKGISFDKSSITVPAGAQVTVNFNNADSGIPHNFAVYTDSGADTSIFVGQVITGPATTTYQFTAPAKAGTYFFRCDIHPSIMNGSFIVQ